MTALLESYVRGSWFRAADAGTPLLDAVTGDEVARVSSTGIDLPGMAEHARTVGGPAPARAELPRPRRGIEGPRQGPHRRQGRAVRAVGPHRRHAARLAGRHRRRHRHRLQLRGQGHRELPNDTVVADGAPEQLGRGGTFAAQHVYTSRLGVAVQINAFNFPVWGMLEKLAPAFLAGLPTIVKPAGQTAYLAELVVRRVIESGVLPEGSLQLLCGSPDGLLDQLGPQDSVAFTGSATTGAHLRQHPSVLRGGVRLGVEADSLNCSVLGPDVTADDPEFALFVEAVVTEMTVKAGQKCTAIRRVIVPSAVQDAVTDAITARLATITVGNPSGAGVSMGALASLGQRDEVRRAVRALQGSAEIVFGDPSTVEVVDADAERGAFLSPILLRARPGASEPHDIEPFGPVATVLAYDGLDDAITLAARGSGSLAGSVVTHDPAVARTLTLGLAPWHGRLLVLDRDDAGESTGHGSPLPVLVHGGPGRAGGGEELGGIRGVLHHMQRTAIQASPDMLTAITGTWTPGSTRTATDIHPFRKSLAELRIGDTIASESRTVTRADIDHFAEFTGDTFYAHTDPDAAARNPLFGGIVAHGYLVVSLAAGLFVDPDPGPVLANFGVDSLRFLTPVKADDSIAVTLTVKQITPRRSADYGEVRWDAVVTNAAGAPVATYDVLTLVAKTWPQDA